MKLNNFDKTLYEYEMDKLETFQDLDFREKYK